VNNRCVGHDSASFCYNKSEAAIEQSLTNDSPRGDYHYALQSMFPARPRS
jgi:hypothetical protein